MLGIFGANHDNGVSEIARFWQELNLRVSVSPIKTLSIQSCIIFSTVSEIQKISLFYTYFNIYFTKVIL